MSPADFPNRASLRLDRCDDGVRAALHNRLPRVRDDPTEATNPDTRGDAGGHEGAERENPATCHENLTPAATSELIAVSPRRELWSERLPDANERQPARNLRESDVVGRNPAARVAI